MGEIVYVDLLFLINFSMDFLCFYITAKILGTKLSVARLLIAAALGGIYSDISLFIDIGRISGVFIDISICFIICAVAFYKKKEKPRLVLHTLVYFAVSMALGGFMTAIFNLLNQADIPISDAGGDGISVWSFALLAAISALITLVGGRFFRAQGAREEAELEIVIGEKRKKMRALFDSGNLLRDPINAKPCIVCDRETLRDILPYDVYAAAKKGTSAIGGMTVTPIRILPIKTAQGDGMMIGISADDIIIDSGRSARSVDAYLALGCVDEGACGARALIPTELLK